MDRSMDLVATLSVFGSVVVDRGQAQSLASGYRLCLRLANPGYGFINNNEVLSNAYVRTR